MAGKKTKATEETKKIYVLDTSVILYDHNAVNEFKENDVAIPIVVLEELDTFKKGNDTKNYEAREFIRFIDTISKKYYLRDWIPLNGRTKGNFKVVMGDMKSSVDAMKIFDDRKNDHKILNAALGLQEHEKDRKVVLVTKDIALRLKAKALNLPAEDYETGKVKDVEYLYSGKKVLENIPPDVIDHLFENFSIALERVTKEEVMDNQYLILKSGKKSVLGYYNPETKMVERVEKHPVYSIKPKNAEQAFAIHALMSENIKLVTIQGVAGTGKTLLALASALEQRRNFHQIYVTRPIVPLSNKDIGYLPGDIKSKLNPYMEPLWDNLKYIKNQFKEADKEFKTIENMVELEKIAITPLTYIRGRSLSNVIFIVDEAQNLTPHEVKTIITRAGENTKIVFTGDVRQIDSPYLDGQSNGLSTLIEKVKGQKLFAHITLEKGERSELANLANDHL